jgi:hypothetical protein
LGSFRNQLASPLSATRGAENTSMINVRMTVPLKKMRRALYALEEKMADKHSPKI